MVRVKLLNAWGLHRFLSAFIVRLGIPLQYKERQGQDKIFKRWSLLALAVCVRALQEGQSGVFPPDKSAKSECPLCFTSQVHEAILRIVFAPVGYRFNVRVRRRAPAALSIVCSLFCCKGPIIYHVALWLGYYTPSTSSDCFFSPM